MRLVYTSVLVAGIACVALLQTSVLGQAPKAAPDPHRALVTTYCVSCHNQNLKTAGLALDGLNLQAAPKDAQIWEKALRKLRGHQMPPPGSPQPPQKDVD